MLYVEDKCSSSNSGITHLDEKNKIPGKYLF